MGCLHNPLYCKATDALQPAASFVCLVPNTDQVYAGEYRRKDGSVLFNDALNTFYLRLYGVRHMVKDHSNGSFICIIPQTG